jgi:hypothetical protein
MIPGDDIFRLTVDTAPRPAVVETSNENPSSPFNDQ